MNIMRALTFLIVCATLAPAADPDPRSQLKLTHAAAVKAGDGWTCLQAEAWGRDQKPSVRLPSILGEGGVIGEPLFAFPAGINRVADWGDRVVVIAAGRAWVVAGDGRPLLPSTRVGEYCGIGYGGGAVAWVNRSREEASVQLTAHRLGDGAQKTSARIPLSNQLVLHDVCVLADDASAAAIGCWRTDPETTITSYGVVIASGESGRKFDSQAPPVAIGRKGAWLIIGGGGGRPMQLMVGEKLTPINDHAAGPGIAAVFSAGKASLVLPDGGTAPLAGVPALGSGANLCTVGGWLACFLGNGVKTISEGDLLGEGAGKATVLPPTVLLWRWADLATNPAAQPARRFEGQLSVASQFPAALWAWHDRLVTLVDLSGPDMRQEDYLTADEPVNWVDTNLHCVRLSHPQQRMSLYGPDRKQLWLGQSSGIEVKRRGLALVRRQKKDHRQFFLVQLSVDPAQRSEVRLEIPDQEHWIQVSSKAPDLAVAWAERGWWRLLDFNGQILRTARDQGLQAVPRPNCPEWSWSVPPGRFTIDGTRLRLRAEEPSTDPLANLSLTDAWRAGGTTILLEVSGRVLVSGRKRNEWVELEPVAAGDRLAIAGGMPVIVAGSDPHVVAALVTGPKLEPREGQATAFTDLPGGSWRLEGGTRFVPPRGRQSEWDVERLGWRPLRLRSPEGGGLFVVTPSLLVELDPAAARFFAR